MRILITGATSGIGRELTSRYAGSGHTVLACGRNWEKLEQLGSEHATVEPLCFDLTDYKNYPQPSDDFKPLDMVILNAGDCEYIDDVLNFDAEMFERVININLVSLGYSLQTWLKHIRSGGRLVLVSSSAGFLPLPRAEAYGSSKAAVSYLGKTLAINLKKYNIEVTVVHPGFVETPLTDKNTFEMPMIISCREAADSIISGLDKGLPDISFPTRFIVIMKCLSFLPSAVWNRLATRMS